MLLKFLIRALVAAAGLWLAAYLIEGVRYDTVQTLLIAAVLLGVVNALVRPVVTVVTFPITLLTLGLFLLVVNAAMIGLVAWLLKGFTVDGLWAGVQAAIVTGAVSWAGQVLLSDARRQG